MSIERITARDVEVGDRISVDGINKPAFTMTAVIPGMRIMGIVKAVRIEMVNDAGLAVGQNVGVSKPMRRAQP